MTKFLKSAVLVAIIGAVGVSPAWADRYRHHHHHHGGGHGHNAVGWGLGILAGSAVLLAATSQPRAYYPPVVAEPVYVQPPVVVPVPAYAPRQNYWYYCAQAGGYYPYVASCPAGWMKVVPN